MRRFYAAPDNFQANEITLGLDETRHLHDVLRLSEGERVQVFDGDGREFLCEIARIEKRATRLIVVETIVSKSPESKLDLALGVALLKGEKFDLVVQKACELGVSKIIPLVTKRCDVRIRDAADAEKRVERWRRIALEAAKQSGRAQLLLIEAPVDFETFLESAAAKKNEKFVLFAETGGESFAQIEATEKLTAIIGAEGGWENAEIEAARIQNFQIVTFGGRILRAETAAIAIAAVLQHRFGDFN